MTTIAPNTPPPPETPIAAVGQQRVERIDQLDPHGLLTSGGPLATEAEIALMLGVPERVARTALRRTWVRHVRRFDGRPTLWLMPDAQKAVEWWIRRRDIRAKLQAEREAKERETRARREQKAPRAGKERGKPPQQPAKAPQRAPEKMPPARPSAPRGPAFGRREPEIIVTRRPVR